MPPYSPQKAKVKASPLLQRFPLPSSSSSFLLLLLLQANPPYIREIPLAALARPRSRTSLQRHHAVACPDTRHALFEISRVDVDDHEPREPDCGMSHSLLEQVDYDPMSIRQGSEFPLPVLRRGELINRMHVLMEHVLLQPQDHG